ncbi:MAG TPA: TetR/AcrR family transcriptional regulator [Solirubrobacterales bacterium]|nr:TetR/AcrR family transcriptional regulator [Solirubrobacterales bacterium]
MVSLPEHLQAKPAGRHRLSPEVRAEHQRERVLDAAIEVFAARGYQRVTIDDIVAAAKVGVGSFYDLFDNKPDCFVQAYERIVSEARERIASAVPAEAGWPEQACAALRALLELIEAEPVRARVALVEVQTAGAEALTRHEETVDSVIPLLARGRAENPALAEILELPSHLEEAIVGGLAWLLQQRLAQGEFDGAEAYLPDVLEIAVVPYVGREKAASLLAASKRDDSSAAAA